MTVPTFGQGTTTDPSSADPGNQGPNINPAWNDALSVVPQEAHSQLIPHLQKWDQNFQQKVSEVQDRYKPYQGLVDNNIDPQRVDLALSVIEAIEENPQAVYEQLGTRFGFGGQQQSPQGNLDQGQGAPTEEMWEGVSPQLRAAFEQQGGELQQLREVAGNMAQIMLQNQETSSQADEDAQLDNTFQELMQDQEFAALNANGEAEPYLITLMMAGMDPGQAAQQYKEFVNGIIKNHSRPAAPRIMPSGGIIPGSSTDVRQLDSQQTKSLVQQMIDAANAQ